MLLMPRAKGFSSSLAWRDSYVLNRWAMLPNRSVRRDISRSKKPFFSISGADRWMYSSGVSMREPTSPVGRRPVGIKRAPGAKSERNRSQLRGAGGPEITSYKAATIESIVATSAGFAAGALAAAGDGAGLGVGVWAFAVIAKASRNTTRKVELNAALTEFIALSP